MISVKLLKEKNIYSILEEENELLKKRLDDNKKKLESDIKYKNKSILSDLFCNNFVDILTNEKFDKEQWKRN